MKSIEKEKNLTRTSFSLQDYYLGKISPLFYTFKIKFICSLSMYTFKSPFYTMYL